MISASILIVEDDPVVAKSLESLLQKLGYHITGIARNPSTAISLFDKSNPDIVLLDIELGQNSTGGIEVAKHIQKKHNLPVIIFLTKFSNQKTVVSASRTLPSVYLTKPFTEKQLESSITSGISKRDIWQTNP